MYIFVQHFIRVKFFTFEMKTKEKKRKRILKNVKIVQLEIFF